MELCTKAVHRPSFPVRNGQYTYRVIEHLECDEIRNPRSESFSLEKRESCHVQPAVACGGSLLIDDRLRGAEATQ